MQKYILGIALSMFLIGYSNAADGDIKLPSPQTEGGMPLMEALNNRSSDRDFNGNTFDNQTMSNILWSAFGINRQDGRRTIPTAKNEQNLNLYALLPSGVYSYNAETNELVLVSAEDFRAKSGRQSEMLGKSAMIVVYVEKLGDSYNKFNSGAATQSVGLYAASAGLANVVIGSANIKELAEILKLPKNMQVQVIQAIGYKN